ncbi:MAG: hypothetical protein ACYCVN_08530 [Acidimicrobiales bacterium]
MSAFDQTIHDWLITVEAFSSIGPPIAYVGFSMGVIFGLPTVAAIRSIRAAVFAVGGIPDGGGSDVAPRCLSVDANPMSNGAFTFTSQPTPERLFDLDHGYLPECHGASSPLAV